MKSEQVDLRETESLSFDLIVIGGGSAGVATAVTAARQDNSSRAKD